jgi:hypothetical protein
LKELMLVPITLEGANEFVVRHHRHHAPVVGHKFSLGVARRFSVVGVAIVGRPVSRVLDNGWTLEVTRCCSDGTDNVCSMLYGAAWRAAKALGYKKLVTYTLQSEIGASLRAAGWQIVAEVQGRNWNQECRPRVDTPEQLRQNKFRWEAA